MTGFQPLRWPKSTLNKMIGQRNRDRDSGMNNRMRFSQLLDARLPRSFMNLMRQDNDRQFLNGCRLLIRRRLFQHIPVLQNVIDEHHSMRRHKIQRPPVVPTTRAAHKHHGGVIAIVLTFKAGETTRTLGRGIASNESQVRYCLCGQQRAHHHGDATSVVRGELNLAFAPFAQGCK